ncbi:MAG: helix-turn-helix transcriptional regulator [Pseudomonadota bacterium]
MLNPATLDIFAPTEPSAFERLCHDLFAELWGDPNAQLFGRSGQRQNGVDIFGLDNRAARALCGVQCKVRQLQDSGLSIKDIQAEIALAEQFTPSLERFLVATTARRDARLQEQVLAISQAREADNKFSVGLLSWDDIKLEMQAHPKTLKKHYPTFFIEPSPASTITLSSKETSRRLVKVINLLNAARGNPRLTPSRLAEMLGFDRSSDIENILTGDREATLSFLRAFASLFSVNPEWLMHGEGDPFYLDDVFYFDALEALPLIVSSKPERVFFTRSESYEGACTITLQYGPYNYRTLPNQWHVSGIVGATGTHQLVSLYKLMRIIYESNEIHGSGQVANEKTFNALANGSIFAGSVLGGPLHTNQDWWFALLDLDHKYVTSPHYGEWYGESLLDAQRIIRKVLSEE